MQFKTLIKKNSIALGRQHKKPKLADDEALASGDAAIQLMTRQLFNLAVKDYRPGSLDGMVALLRATETQLIDDTPLRTTVDDDVFGWRQRTIGNLLVFDVPGGHLSMLQPPNAYTLAVELNKCIRRALPDSFPTRVSVYEPVRNRAKASRELTG